MDQLRALRIVSRVVSEGSFAAAARAMDLAPAGVTRAVAELEQHLGARLMQRSTRKLALTEVGQTYVEHARRILAELDEADALATDAATEARGSVRVQAPPAFVVHQLIKHLSSFHQRYPEVRIELSASGPVGAADEGFDVSIVSVGQQPLQGEFIARRLARSAFVVCATPQYLREHGTPLQPQDLLSHQGLLPAVSAVRREFTLFPVKGGTTTRSVSIATPTPMLTTSHIETLRAAALAGLGIAGLPSFAVADDLAVGRLVRVLPQWRGLQLNLYAATPSRKHLPARTRVLVDFLVQTFGGTDKDPWV